MRTELPDAHSLADPVFRWLKIVVVSGGEPTLRPDLEEILASIHRAVPKARIALSSNAMHPERLLAAVRSALDQKIVLEVGVSLDAMGVAHDALRGVPDLFQKVDYTLRELFKLKRVHGKALRVTAGFVLSDATVAHLEEVRRYVEGLGATFNVQWYNQAPYYGNVGCDRLTKKGELEQAVRKLRPTVLHAVGMRVLRGEAMAFHCSAMFNFCLLKCDGDLVPCFRLWDRKVGNVRQQTPSDIWTSFAAKEARSLVRDCQGCLNTCGVLWSYDANPSGRIRFFLRHPDALVEKLWELIHH